MLPFDPTDSVVRFSYAFACTTTDVYMPSRSMHRKRRFSCARADRARGKRRRLGEEEDATQQRQARIRARRAAEKVQHEPAVPLALRYNAAEPPTSCNIGCMTDICAHCSAKKFHGETPRICCAGGKVNLEAFPPPPPFLKNLLDGSDRKSKHFLQQIRQYNNAFSMTSKSICTTSCESMHVIS